MKFRKKPVVIEAWPVRELVHAAAKEWPTLPECIQSAYETGAFVFTPEGIVVSTLEGSMMADLDDMLIRGVKGEFYPCKPDIFAATYEPVAGATTEGGTRDGE